jgi:hypothetical protein
MMSFVGDDWLHNVYSHVADQCVLPTQKKPLILAITHEIGLINSLDSFYISLCMCKSKCLPIFEMIVVFKIYATYCKGVRFCRL